MNFGGVFLKNIFFENLIVNLEESEGEWNEMIRKINCYKFDGSNDKSVVNT